MSNCQWSVSRDQPSKASEESGGLHSLPYKHHLLSLAVLTLSIRRRWSSNILFIVSEVLIPTSSVALIVVQCYNGLTANGLI